MKKCKDCKNMIEDGRYSRCPSCREKQRKRDNEIKNRYVSQGICYKCRKNPVEDGKTKCRECLDDDIKKHKKRYYSLKSEKLCVSCGKNVAEKGKVKCAECANMINQEHKESLVFYRKIGICPKCKKEPIYLNEKLCFDCSEKERESNKKYRESHREEVAKRKRDWQRERNERLSSDGICVRCGKEKVYGNTKRCLTCLIKCREENRKSRGITIRRSERPYYGMCFVCGAEIESGKVCEKCKQVAIKNLEKANEALEQKRDNHIWNGLNKMIGCGG